MCPPYVAQRLPLGAENGLAINDRGEDPGGAGFLNLDFPSKPVDRRTVDGESPGVTTPEILYV